MLSTTGVIRVAVVDDQPLLVSAFSALVAAQPDMEVVLEAVDGRQAVEGLTARATGHHGGGRPGAHGSAYAGPGRGQCHS